LTYKFLFSYTFLTESEFYHSLTILTPEALPVPARISLPSAALHKGNNAALNRYD